MHRKEPETAPAPTVRSYTIKTNSHSHNIYAEDLEEMHSCTLIVALVFASPHEPRLVDSLGLLLVVSWPSGFYTMSSLSSSGFPVIHQMFDCESLHLLQEFAAWTFSDDNYSRLWSMSIAEYNQESLLWLYLLFFHPWYLSYQASGCWPFRQCQIWVPIPTMGLNLSFGGHTFHPSTSCMQDEL